MPPGKLTIVRDKAHGLDPQISLELRDDRGVLVEVTIAPEHFMLALTGVARQPCTYTRRGEGSADDHAR